MSQEQVYSSLFNSTIEIGFPIIKKFKEDFIIAGYASVEVIDKQDELIPIPVIKEAWEQFKANKDFYFGSLMHSNVPVIKVLDTYTDSSGVVWKSGVDENGLFIVAKVRQDIQKGKQTWELIEKGKLTGFSIGGEALSSTEVCEGKCFTRIDKMELHEIAVVDKPANAPSVFKIVKRDSKKEIKVEKPKIVKEIVVKFNIDKLDIVLKRMINKPFAGYSSFAECERENQQARNPGAYCAAIQEEVEKLDKKIEKKLDVESIKEKLLKLEEERIIINGLANPEPSIQQKKARSDLEILDIQINAIKGEIKRKNEELKVKKSGGCDCPVDNIINKASLDKIDDALKLIPYKGDNITKRRIKIDEKGRT